MAGSCDHAVWKEVLLHERKVHYFPNHPPEWYMKIDNHKEWNEFREVLTKRAATSQAASGSMSARLAQTAGPDVFRGAATMAMSPGARRSAMKKTGPPPVRPEWQAHAHTLSARIRLPNHRTDHQQMRFSH